jgi:hypothetical protein
VRSALRPGRYVVSCSHAQTTQDVPWSDAAFSVVRRRVDGLWTGAVRAGDVAVQIATALRPTLTIDAPLEIVPGASCVVDAVLENPTGEDAEFAGRLVCRAWTKAEGAVATVRAASDDDVVRVPAGGRARFTLDFSRAEPLVRRRLAYAVLVATIEKDQESVAIESNALFRSVKPPPDAAMVGLRLTATPRRGPGGEPLVELALRNAGADVLRVPRDLAAPASVTFLVRRRDRTPITIETADAKSTSNTVEWTSTWPASRDEPAYVELRPGDALTRIVDLSDAAHPALPAGGYALTATWWNVDRESGDVVVGQVASEAVAVDR